MTDIPDRKEAVISLWPEFAEAIVSGKKTVEFRRRIPLWSRYGREAFLSEQQYRDYFEGTEKATAFLLRDHQLIRPINLDQLKEIRPNFEPPQSLTWLREEETPKLVSLTSQVE